MRNLTRNKKKIKLEGTRQLNIDIASTYVIAYAGISSMRPLTRHKKIKPEGARQLMIDIVSRASLLVQLVPSLIAFRSLSPTASIGSLSALAAVDESFGGSHAKRN